ncbi:MAG: glycine--tRNA ligase subunit beta [Deltaproteobacteria bacterium]|nr:glycine--tRNA ligase subunit beta [Deltaproteobacteria bacterium]
MGLFALEVGTEEMPARFLPTLEQALQSGFDQVLTREHLEHGPVETHSTPRRLLVFVERLAETQTNQEIVVTGPPAAIAFQADGSPSKAAQGFARTHGVETDDLFVQTTDKGQYLAARKATGGARALDILPGVCREILSALPFPKKMHWAPDGFLFGRPVRWILALLDNDVVPFELACLSSGRLTFGHRVMGPGPFSVPTARELSPILLDRGRIVADRAQRMAMIVEQGDRLAAEAGGTIIWSDRLLSQVADLVEWPTAMLGRFDQAYLALPREVLLTSMEAHQKSFGLEGPDGALLPAFLTVVNIESERPELVRQGWEKVLRARLEDARFFWEADSKADLDDWLKSLESVVFLGPLGSMGDKSRRLKRLAGGLAALIDPGLELDMARAGRLAKADLVSHMVGEFDDLQGIMGGIYTRQKGESERVAQALYEQYLPAGPDTRVPKSLPGAVLALADRLDNLIGCFGLGMAPTGAADPYALRRQTLGLTRILLEHGLRLELRSLLKMALDEYGSVKWKLPSGDIVAAVEDFIGQRLKALWGAQGIDGRLLEACLRAGLGDLPALKARVAALEDFSRADDFEQAALAFKRADNIIRKQGDRAGAVLTGKFDVNLLQEDGEKKLAAALEGLEDTWAQALGRDDYPELFGLLRTLRPTVDGFFDQVMVMCEDQGLRLNRLNILQALVNRLSALADFSALQV